jgi:SAM-dependent methyltransferase
MKKLQRAKEELVKMILPRPISIREEYLATVSAFAFSYSMGRTIRTFCEKFAIHPETGRVLIVGAAGGRDFHWLTGSGYTVDVLDLNVPPWECQAYLGDACQADTWLQIDKQYDLIIMCDVLEHLPEDYNALKLARKALKKDGYLFLSLPYDHDVEVTHVRSYSESTLTRLLRTAGYNPVWKKDRPGLIEAFPGIVNSLNYGLVMATPTPRQGASLLHSLLKMEYFLNEKTRKLYRVLGSSIQKGIIIAATPAENGPDQDYVSQNKEMFSYSK